MRLRQVHASTRFERICNLVLVSVMENEWRQRLISAIEADPRTPRAISMAAGLGPNFLNQMMARGTSPSTSAVVALSQALGISLTYLFTGAEMTPEDEELLRLSGNLPEDRRQLLLAMARSWRAGEQH
jgi:transcriptional regulator with XRE-family HTH domain